jgi:hypothetical protein
MRLQQRQPQQGRSFQRSAFDPSLGDGCRLDDRRQSRRRYTSRRAAVNQNCNEIMPADGTTTTVVHGRIESRAYACPTAAESCSRIGARAEPFDDAPPPGHSTTDSRQRDRARLTVSSRRLRRLEQARYPGHRALHAGAPRASTSSARWSRGGARDAAEAELAEKGRSRTWRARNVDTVHAPRGSVLSE